MKKQFKPHDLATIQLPTSSRRRVVEVISHPIPAERFSKPETIKVRMVPGEPTTIAEVEISELAEGRRPQDRYVHVAEVRSGFTFPEDMLRYDDAALYRHDLHEDGEYDPSLGHNHGLDINESTDTDLTQYYRLGGSGRDAKTAKDNYVRKPRVLVYRLSSARKSPWATARWHSFSASITPLVVRDLRSGEIVWHGKRKDDEVICTCLPRPNVSCPRHGAPPSKVGVNRNLKSVVEAELSKVIEGGGK